MKAQQQRETKVKSEECCFNDNESHNAKTRKPLVLPIVQMPVPNEGSAAVQQNSPSDISSPSDDNETDEKCKLSCFTFDDDAYDKILDTLPEYDWDFSISNYW